MLTIRNISRAFDHKPVLQDIDLDVTKGEILCLLGPSGCGKTTLLRIIAGLERADSGEILLEGQPILNTPVHTRDFGFMFQDFALFPHMNVAQNIAFGLKMRNLSREPQQQKVREMLDIVGLAGFEKRDIGTLSGGEKQRIALARSLAPEPRLLMLDEPLGSLDASLRERLLNDLREIIKRLGLTAIYVTHDQQEAFAVADRIALMNMGHIEQVDSPEVIYAAPKTVFSTHFLGFHNIFPILRWNNDLAETLLGSFALNREAKAVLIHPDHIELGHKDSPNSHQAVVKSRTFLGEFYRLWVETDSNAALTFKIRADSTPMPVVGKPITFRFSSKAILPLR